MNDELKILQDLFLGYFHEDWPEEYGTPVQAVTQFIDESSPEELNLAASAIDALLAGNPSEDELKEILFDDMESHYDPTIDGVTLRTWLEQLRAKFS